MTLAIIRCGLSNALGRLSQLLTGCTTRFPCAAIYSIVTSMPYAILVSALGAIVSTAIALFGLHSLAALKTAPIIGALLGLLFAILSLRRYELPLNSTFEDYRSVAGVVDTPKLHLNVALGVGLIVSLIELPTVMLGQDITLPICVIGWVVVLGGTVYRSCRFNGSTGRLDVFQITGGVAFLVISGWIMYTFAEEIKPGMQIIPIGHLARVIFVLNGFAAFISAVLSFFGLAIVSKLGAGTALRR